MGDEFLALGGGLVGAVRWFARYREGERDEVTEGPSERIWTDAGIYAFGALVSRRP